MDALLEEKELGTLPKSGKDLWEKVYNSSRESKDSKEVAARKAWAAVKGAFHKDDEGVWVKNKSDAYSELSMTIHKVSVDKSQGGVMRWRAVASDTSPDLYDESMSNELFDDFINRIESKSEVPQPFSTVLNEEWSGGMPYLSIAHYKSGTGSKNVPGMPEKIYRDGDRLKAVGTLNDTPLGRAVFKSLCEDLYTEKAKEEGKIRISIGFLDLQHKHLGEGNVADYVFTRSGLEDKCPMCQKGVGKKVYLKGQLVHLALTRVPVNPRTDMEVGKSMIETKKDDAASIVGVELSEALEEKSQAASEVIVTKSDEVPVESVVEVTPEVEPIEKAKVAADKQTEDMTYEEEDEQKREERRNRPAGERSLLQKSFDDIESKIEQLKSQGVPAETALREIHPLYASLGEQVKKSFEPESTSQSAPNKEIEDLVAAVKSIAESMSTFQQSVSTELATLKAQVVTKSAQGGIIPEPRSISAKSVAAQPQQAATNKPLSIKEIAYKSTFR